MPRLNIEDLNKLRDDAKRMISLRVGRAAVKVTVHMGSCGIAAGAREVMHALLDEMTQTDRQDIHVFNSDCLGVCGSEPNVTVDIEGKAPVVYQHVDGDKMRQIFKRHVLMGEVQSDFVIKK